MATYPWQKIVVPLVDGTSEDASDLDARTPGIQYSENVEFGRKGELRPRPGFVKHDQIGWRNYDNVGVTIPVDAGPTTLATTGLQPRSMFRYRDAVGERAGLLCDGRVFTWEGDRFTDRLFAMSARVDRLVEVQQFLTDAAANQIACADNFSLGNADSRQALFLGTTPSQEYFVPGVRVRGNADIVTTGGHDYHCVVGNTGTDNNLRLCVRRDYDNTLTITTIRTDCINVTGFGDAPSCSAFGSSLYVVYRKNAATDHYILLQVNPVTSVVTLVNDVTIPSGGPPHVLKGIWINATAGVLFVAHTREDQGAFIKVYNTALVDQALDSTLDGGTAKLSSGPVVIGAKSATVAWVAYTRDASVGSAFKDLVVGKYQTSGPRSDIARVYLGSTPAANTPALSWGITHQPLLVRGRVILGITAGSGVTSQRGATWYDIDVTDLAFPAGSSGLGQTTNAGYVARGPTEGTKEPYGPQAAVLLVTSPALFAESSTWRFPTMNYTRFSGTGSSTPSLGINQVKLQEPQVVQAGEETIIGGAVPHSIARGYSAEQGFPFLGAPELTATANAAGSTLPLGSYTVQATWRWTDEAGVIHRSGPSLPVSVTTTAPLPSILWTASTYQLTEREFGTLYLEIWCTDTNPVNTAPKYLVGTALAGPSVGAANNTGFVLSPVSITEETLYTSGGAIFANSHVSADGGCAAQGRRIWLSDGVNTYASKRFPNVATPNTAAAWNDEGVLQVTTPSTAGRVVALHALGDKLALMCERGIYVTQGEGPDDTGLGPDFLYPVRVSDLGCAGPRSSVVTDQGIFFHAANTAATNLDAAYGGIYLYTGGEVQQVSMPVVDDMFPYLTTTATAWALDYNPERQLLYINTGVAILVLDIRAKQWTSWPYGVNMTGGLCLTVASGVLWVTTAALAPGAYTGTPGNDLTGTTDPYTMLARTNHMFSNGEDGLGWANVRSLRVLGEPATHVLALDITYDQLGPTAHKEFNLVTGVATPNWPSERYAPEWLIPRQKCSSLQVQLSATPATGAWVALRLDVLPRKYAPARVR